METQIISQIKKTTKHGHKNSEEERSGLSSGTQLTNETVLLNFFDQKCEVSPIWHI